MANRLTSNPIYFDQFGTDVTLAKRGTPLTVTKIRWISVDDGDVFQLEDAAGNVIFKDVGDTTTGTDSAVWREVNFAGGFTFGEGVVIDVSDCAGMAATNGTDAVWIYLK